MDEPISFGISPATIADLPAIRAIVEGAYRPYVAVNGLIPAPLRADYDKHLARGELWVLSEDYPSSTGDTCARTVGVLVLVEKPDHLLLDNVALHPGAQGKGYGRDLITYAENHARWAGFSTIRLYTQEIMTKNIALYTALGYVETHRATEDGLPRVYMEKRL